MKRPIKIALGMVFVLAACQDPVTIQPASLDGPTAVTVARGRVCLTQRESNNRFIPKFAACEYPQEGGIGLVVNENSDRLTFFELDSEPELANLNPGIPGVSHLPVGRLPVDVAASPDGTVAYTLNQIDMDVSIVNLWGPSVLPKRFSLARTPIAFDVRSNTGELVIAINAPSRLVILGGAQCDDASTCTVSEADPKSLELRGTATDVTVAPDGSRAYVAYRELDQIDVVDLDQLRITDSIAIAFECNDGIDNDGDGLIDQQDPLCFGPNGAESIGGMGRDEHRDCADTVDNDNDGLIDRDDPDCFTSAGSEEPSGLAPPVAQCNDGLDNDNDGLIDYPDDPDCYGPFGRTEQPVLERGFDAIDIDPLGAFVYAVDRARNQVIVIDATRNTLIDVSASSVPSGKSFNSNFGLITSPSPLDVRGAVRRDCLDENNNRRTCDDVFFFGDPNDPNDDYSRDTVVVIYTYNAWVSEDSGRLRELQVMDSFCEIPTEAAYYLGDSSMPTLTTPFNDLERYAASDEANCFTVPSFPLEERDDWQGTCDVTCESDCDEDLMKSRFYCSNGTSVVVNPLMGLLDADSDVARTSGKGRCEIPPSVSAQMRTFAAEADTPRNFICNSMLLPQPLVLEVQDLDANAYQSLLNYQRADIIQKSRSYIGFLEDNIEIRNFTSPFDERIVSEGWTVEYEGLIPSTRRSDGLLARDTSMQNGRPVVEFTSGSLDLCKAGVEVGDSLVLTIAPTDIENCSEFVSEEDDFLTFEIVDRDAGTYTLGLIPDPDGTGRYVQTLPTRACFQTGTNYEVHVSDTWLVYGSRSGLISDKESLFGECVPVFGTAEQAANPDAQTPTRASRVDTGEVFHGPYLSFYLFPGPDRLNDNGEPVLGEPAVKPEPGLTFNFDIDTNFVSRSVVTEGVFPTKLDIYEVGGQYRVISTDSNANFLFYKSIRFISEEGSRLR